MTLEELKDRRRDGGGGDAECICHDRWRKTEREEWRDRGMSMKKREERSCQQNQMAVRQTGLKKIQLKCGVKTGFEVGHGA